MTYILELFRAWWHRRCVLRMLRRMERDAEKVEAYWEKNAYKHWLAK